MPNVSRALVVSAFIFVACSNTKTATLLRTVAEPAGANCATGGLALQTGPDTNGNTTLDADEVNASLTTYLCNGTTGAAGAAGAPGAPGATGATGSTGDSGTPGDAGSSGFNALTSIVAEPAGTNCEYGGSRVEVGLDTDRSGTLEASEVTTSTYVCEKATLDTVYFGDVNIQQASDLAILNHIQVVVGNVYVTITPDAGIVLAELTQISGSLQLRSPDSEEGFSPPPPEPSDAGITASFPSLVSVSELHIEYVSYLTAFSAPKLATITNFWRIQNDPVLTSIDLSSLSHSNDFEVYGLPALTSLALPALSSASNFNIYDNPVLTSIDLSSLSKSSYFQVFAMPALTSLALPALSSTSGFRVYSNAVLTSIDLSSLSQSRYFQVYSMPALTSLELPALSNGSGFSVNENAVLNSLSVPKYLGDGSEFHVENNPLLATISLTALKNASYISVQNNPALLELTLPALVTNSALDINNNSSLTIFSVPALHTNDFFNVAGDGALSTCQLYRQLLTFTTQPAINVGNDDTSENCHAELCHSVTVTGITDTIEKCSFKLPFEDARVECQRAAGAGTIADLVWFKSHDEVVGYQAAAGTIIPVDSWLGYTDTASEGTFVPVVAAAYDPTTDHALEFWAPSQPDNAGGIENYLGVVSSGVNDFPSYWSLLPICRVSAAPVAP